jgi:hypothetical protein
VGSVDRRLQNLERLVEGRVEARVMEELGLVVDRLEHHLTGEELRRVLEILAGEEGLQAGPSHIGVRCAEDVGG